MLVDVDVVLVDGDMEAYGDEFEVEGVHVFSSLEERPTELIKRGNRYGLKRI